VIDIFQNQKLEVAAGVRQQLIAFASQRPDVRVMDGRFMVIEQAVGMPKGRTKGHAFVKSFVEDEKASGMVADALARSDQRDVSVAPLAQ
jgi:polar amino acid transport system substrate-binding protein